METPTLQLLYWPLFNHTSPGQWHRCAIHTETTRIQGPKDNNDLHPHHDKNIGIH